MILVDAYWLLHKCRASLDFLKNMKGRHTGMEYGFLKSCEALERDLNDKVILCWESRSFRYELFTEYKANREGNMDSSRIAEFKEFCKQIYRWAEYPGLEGDDVIASLCGREYTTIYSNDKDMMQLIDEQTVQLKSFRDKKFPWTPETVELKMDGLRPSELPLFFAWTGDAVDNIPGSGLGPSRVAKAIVWSRNTGQDWSEWPMWSAKHLYILETFDPTLNLQLVKPKIEDVQIVEPLWNKGVIEKWLLMMDIASLKICRGIIFEGAEF